MLTFRRWTPGISGTLWTANQPAALWKTQDNGYLSERSDIQDRSRTSRHQSDDFKQNDAGKSVDESSCMKDLYPWTRPVQLRSAGFVQIQDLIKSNNEFTCSFNVWVRYCLRSST